MAKKKNVRPRGRRPVHVVITMESGGVTDVRGLPHGAYVEIRDYDVPDSWGSAIEDKDGARYQSIVLRHNGPQE